MKLYMSVFLHQTTTWRRVYNVKHVLYMSVFLHQTTTRRHQRAVAECCICLFSYIKPQRGPLSCRSPSCCICLFSYIKPQRSKDKNSTMIVVYVCFPTSNHNWRCEQPVRTMVVYVCFPTSNHNHRTVAAVGDDVVYVCFPTSNHNLRRRRIGVQ